jgi:hypothetical protein
MAAATAATPIPIGFHGSGVVASVVPWKLSLRSDLS